MLRPIELRARLSEMGGCRSGRIKASHQELREALRGRVTYHHRFLLHVHLQHIDFADAAIRDIDLRVQALITQMDEEVKAGQASFRSLIALLVTIPA